MHLSIGTLVIVMSVPTAFACIHTTCYNYFLTNEGCVYSNPDGHTRCPAPPKCCPEPVPQCEYGCSSNNSTLHKRSGRHTLARRYDNPHSSFIVAGGGGICGPYDTNEEEGVCLWTGTSFSGQDPATAGWLNGAQPANCGKRVYIQRRGRPETAVYATVKDGCTFNTLEENVGCCQIGLTRKTFNALCPTPQEQASQVMEDITWDFDNVHGCHPELAPV